MNETNATSPAPTSFNTDVFAANSSEFVNQLYISIPIGLALILFYCYIRRIYQNRWEIRRKFAISSTTNNDEDGDEDDNTDNDLEIIDPTLSNKKQITFPQISDGFISWIYDVWIMDNFTFYRFAGFDALVFILYLKGCIYICIASLPYALLILLPVYGTAKHGNNEDWIDMISLSTIKQESNRLYAAVIGSYVFTFIALYYLSKVYLVVAYATDQFFIGSSTIQDIDNVSWFNYKGMIDNIVDFNVNLAKKPIGFVGGIYSKGKGFVNKEPIIYRHSLSVRTSIELNMMEQLALQEEKEQQALQEEKEQQLVEIEENKISPTDDEIQQLIPSIDRYTVMIRNLPKPFRDEKIFKQFMEQLFADKIVKVIIVPDVQALNQIHNKIKFHKNKLKKLAKKLNFNINDIYSDETIPEIYEGTKCCGCCGEQINLIKYHRDNKVALIRKFNKMKKKGLSTTPTAFIIFSSLKEASNCISSPIRFGLTTLKISKAPHPNDLFWDNLKYKQSDLYTDNLLVMVAMFFLLIFWSIPVAAIQGLANLGSMFKAFGGNIDSLNLEPSTIATLQGTLAVLILDLWLQLLPFLAELLTKIQKKAYRGRYETLVMTKYYDCLVFQVLLVTVIAGSVANGAGSFAETATNLVVSINNIFDELANGLSNMSVYFLLYVLLNTFLWLPVELYRPGYHFAAKFNLSEPNRFHYPVWYAKSMLILTILLTYSVMNPIMWILGLMYFVGATFVFTYNLSMNWIPEFETGAKQWPLVFGRIRFAFMISIFTLIGLMTLKQAYICSALLIPLAVFAWFVTGNIDVKFRKMFRAPSLTSARSKDREMINLINNGNENGLKHLGDEKQINNAYLPPVMSVNYKTFKR